MSVFPNKHTSGEKRNSVLIFILDNDIRKTKRVLSFLKMSKHNYLCFPTRLTEVTVANKKMTLIIYVIKTRHRKRFYAIN